MRISFDLDDTLICYGEGHKYEPRIGWFARLVIWKDEPLRKGTKQLADELTTKGHEIWIYTTSYRHPRRVRRWLRQYGISVQRVINGKEHERRFGLRSSPTKRPHVFGIDLHVDDSPGVKIEGDQHGFEVCVVKPGDRNWVSQVLQSVDRQQERSSGTNTASHKTSS